jgi:predicted DNA binding CopG/RHH family protein
MNLMTKKVSIKTKKSREAEADAWVKDRKPAATATATAEGETMKRLTIDVSESLHKRIKTYCAANGLIMADEIRSILEEKFPNT